MAEQGSIVVGTDGSNRAERAVDRAGEIAHALGVSVHVVSGYRASSDAGWMVSVAGVSAPTEPDTEDQERVHAQSFVDRAQRRLSDRGVATTAHVLPGDPAEALMRVADEQEAQMIVIGNRGMSGARRMLGSVPNHVSHHARCGVLIVPTAD